MEGFARALHTALTLDAGTQAARVAAAQATAAVFSEANFDRELASAWQRLLGPQAQAFQMPTVTSKRGEA